MLSARHLTCRQRIEDFANVVGEPQAFIKAPKICNLHGCTLLSFGGRPLTKPVLLSTNKHGRVSNSNVDQVGARAMRVNGWRGNSQ